MTGLIIFVFLIVAVMIYLRRSDSKQEAAELAQARSSQGTARSTYSPYSAVSIVVDLTGPGACDAVKAIGDRRFLVADAPELPLPECNCRCACKFAHFRDRRDTREDRRRPRSLQADLYDKAERRGRPGRRASD
jgi:hypothetical protein